MQTAEPATRQVTFTAALAIDLTAKGKLRRWDSPGPVAVNANGVNIPIDLEGGIQVAFSAGSYRAGDYWLVPARTEGATIEWPGGPAPVPWLPQPPQGVRHRYCRLALLSWDGTGWSLLDDCRETFDPLAVGLRVTRVLARGGYGQDLVLHNGDTLQGGDLAQGLRVFLNRDVEPTAVPRAACAVTLELPYSFGGQVPGIWGIPRQIDFGVQVGAGSVYGVAIVTFSRGYSYYYNTFMNGAACLHYHARRRDSSYAGVRIDCLFADFGDAYRRGAEVGYTHLLGSAKQDPHMLSCLEERVCRDYPAHYERCLRYCRGPRA